MVRSVAVLFFTLSFGLQPASKVQAQDEPDSRDARVLIVGLDGLRPDALAKADTPVMDGLIERGAFTDTCLIQGEYKASATISGPGWASIVTGTWANKHGIHNNGFQGRNLDRYPPLFAYVNEHTDESQTLSLAWWKPVHEYLLAGFAGRSRREPMPQGDEPNWVRHGEQDERLAEQASSILSKHDIKATFLYLGQTDNAGHTKGFSPEVPEYIEAIEQSDRRIGMVLEAIHSRETYEEEDWLVIIISDHGGQGRSHSGGHEVPEILNVPLIVSGDAAKTGRIDEQAYLVDVAPTALTHLGIEIDAQWELDGRPVGLRQ